MSDQSRSKGRDARLGISGWPLRRKVALALAIPLLLAATFGGLRVTNDLEQSNNASASAKQVTVLEPAIAYLTAAEKGMVAAQSATGTTQDERDNVLAEIKSAADELLKVRGEAELTAEQGLQVDVILDLSRALRDEATGPLSPGTWLAQLRQMQSGVTKLIATIINAQLTPEPRLELLSQALSGRFSLAMQQALAETDRSGSTGSLALFAELGAELAALDRLAGQLGDTDAAIQSLRTNNGERTREVRTGGSDLGGASAYDDYDTLQATLIDGVDQQLADTAFDARSSALLNALLTLIALAAAIALAVMISRTLVNPIRRVREGALKVAQHDLPDAVARIRSGSDPGPISPIDVTTHEEVGQLARAVEDLHRQAVTLASGEARLRSQVGEMFVTLSRRNTTLINQQLSLIEALESDEEDPKRLESLFRLDHLAARMRRTADSLLILADAPTRSAGWESVSIGETLQAATAGVTDYQRVRVESTRGLLVDEAAAGDLVHLLTELVDNSLAYSSPHTSVVLAATETDNGVTITVADAGLGIPAEELEQINADLHTGVEVTPDTARRMGLFVVSRLAQRHGISVTLKANPGDGMTAHVLVPNAILPARAHIAPVPVEPEVVEPAVVAEAAPVEEQVEEPAAETTSAGVTPLPTRTPGEPTVDASDPLGIGDAYLHPAGPSLPTRERGATLSHLTAAGVQLPRTDDDGNDVAEPPRELKRATGAMPLRSKRDLDAAAPPPPPSPAPTVAAVPDLPVDTEPPELEPEPEPEPDPEESPEAHIAALMAKIRPQHGRLPIPDYDEVDHAEILRMPGRERGSLDADPLAEPFPVIDPFPVASDEPVEASWVEDTTEAPVAPLVSESAFASIPEQRAPAQHEEPSINGATRSSWLSTDELDRTWTSTEVEAGWQRADTVAETHDEATSEVGLPVRRPGARLVPGSVTKPVGAAGRDPEAIRARLSAHKAGVRRGRTASVSTDDR